jgi:hypothetical protein
VHSMFILQFYNTCMFVQYSLPVFQLIYAEVLFGADIIFYVYF